jgi:hypothetical protein
MTKHQDTGQRCLVMHHDGYGQCVICECGAHVRPHEWREHIGAAVEALSAKRDAEAAVIEAAKAIRDVPFTYQFGSEHWIQAFDKLDIAVTALRALEGDA